MSLCPHERTDSKSHHPQKGYPPSPSWTTIQYRDCSPSIPEDYASHWAADKLSRITGRVSIQRGFSMTSVVIRLLAKTNRSGFYPQIYHLLHLARCPPVPRSRASRPNAVIEGSTRALGLSLYRLLLANFHPSNPAPLAARLFPRGLQP